MTAPAAAPTPVAESPAPGVRGGRKRGGRWLVPALTVGGVVAVLFGTVAVAQDAHVPTASDGAVLGAPTFEASYVDAPTTELVLYDHGGAVGIGLELRNDGPLPITIEEVPIGPMQEEFRLLHPTEVLVAPPGTPVSALGDALAPFEPFRLGAGETRTVVVSGVFYNCAYYTERAMDLIVSQPVTWSVAGLTTTTEIALTNQLGVRSPNIRECPGRVMDRSARTRTGR